MIKCSTCETEDFCTETMGGRCLAAVIYEKYGEASPDDELEELSAADAREIEMLREDINYDEPASSELRDLIFYALKN